MRTTIFRSSSALIVLAGALVAPALLRGQRTDSVRTHVVRAGETLWRIAADSLGDGRRWREIRQLNPTVVGATDRLETGTRLILPGARRGPAAAPGGAARRPVEAEPALARRRGAVAEAPMPAPPAGRSIFYDERAARARALAESLGAHPADTGRGAAAVRSWEYVSAPFAASGSALDSAGRCLARNTAQGLTGAAPSAFRIADQLAVALPAASRPDTGVRLLTARLGPSLPSLGVVVLPTGIVRVIRAPSGTSPALAEVVAQFDTLSCADLLLPLELPPARASERPVAVSNGAVGSVAWVASTAVLPSLQHRIIIDIGAGAGLRPGDQITLFTGSDQEALTGARVVALATVLRVGTRTSTALIIRQAGAGIQSGMPVRVSAKLP